MAARGLGSSKVRCPLLLLILGSLLVWPPGTATALPVRQPSLEALGSVTRPVEPESFIHVDVINLARDIPAITCLLGTVGSDRPAGAPAGSLGPGSPPLRGLASGSGAPRSPAGGKMTATRLSARVTDGQASCHFGRLEAGVYHLEIRRLGAAVDSGPAAAADRPLAVALLPFLGQRLKVRIIVGR